jgi:exoribonuclease R
MHTLHIANREYTEWSFKDTAGESCTTIPEVSPLSAKLFHGDIIDLSGQLISSPYRDKKNICGVLLSSQKTYGRVNSGNKLLYKCVPDDPHLPCFLVPYEEKHIGFTKTRTDKYISFRVKEWTEKHPHGLIVETFGEVEDTNAYIAYQMANKELNDSLKHLNSACLRSLRENTLGPIPRYCEEKPIEDRRGWQSSSIISIDPKGCKDIDDAIGLRILPNGETILSIYIANVPMMLEYLNLWPYLSERIATIYFPDTKFPLLPVMLSENSCSLRENEDRVVFVMDVTIRPHTLENVSKINFTSAIIRVEKNYAYDAAELIARSDYKQILKIVESLNEDHYQYIDHHIETSHDLIEYCMLFMNHECAKHLKTKKDGIYRSAIKKKEETTAPSSLKHILQTVAGNYCAYAELKPHELIGSGGVECYLHITSPIRRIVDLLNMYEMLKDKFQWSAEAERFAQMWKSKVEQINVRTKSIRKLQNEIELLNVYEKNREKIYSGIVFAQQLSLAGEEKVAYKYKLYIPETKLLTTIISNKVMKDYTDVYCSAHLFLDEAKMAKKIRLQLL